MNKYYKAMLSMMLVFILGFFGINANAQTCIDIPSDQLDDASMSEVSAEMAPDDGSHVTKYINNVKHEVWKENGRLYCKKFVVSQNMKDSNGNPIKIGKDNFSTGAGAANSEKGSKNYNGPLWDGNTSENYAPEGEIVDQKYDPNTNTTTSEILFSQDISKLDPGNAKQLDLAYALVDVNPNDREKIRDLVVAKGNRSTENAEDIERQVDDIQKMMKEGRLSKHIEKLEKTRAMGLATRETHQPQQICDEDTPDGQRACAIWNKIPQPRSVRCDDGTHQGVRVKCDILKEQEPKSSYTTSTPDNSDPYIKDRSPICNDQREGMLMFSQIMNPFGDRTFSNSDILNNGINNFNKKRPADKFDNNYWKTSYRGDGREIRKWNPFKDGNRLSGIPYKVFWTGKFDGWYDQSYNINPMITESINHVKKMENNNSKIASKYNQNGNKFNIFLKAPNNKMKVTALNLDTNTWDSADTGNLYCTDQYMLKIEPRYNLERYTIYQKYDHHITQGESYTYTCVDTDECKSWDRDCEEYEENSWKCKEYGDWYCTSYYTRGEKSDLGGIDTKYPDGQSTEGPTPAGSIPPIYKQRRKYQYRTGALVEYHTMTRPYGKTTMIPVPNSKDTSKMKSGYGFGYTSGVQMITDYDRAPSTYKFNPVIIRPNKATNLNIRTNNYKSSYGLFDSNVHYDKAKNAPERSSSIDKTFIEETLRGGLTKTTFKPSAISNVEKVDGKAKDFTDVESMPVKSSMVRKTAVKWGEMTSTFKISSNPAKYYHAYWKTKGEPNLIPAYKPGPLHYVYLDYPSGTDYTVASLDTINLNGKGFFATGMNTGSIKIVGNMWEDSFSRPNFKK